MVERKKFDRKALGGVYKKSFVYAVDIELDQLNIDGIYNVLYNMVSKDFTNIKDLYCY